MKAFDFAREWVDGWNSHDLDRIMGHYRADIRFRSRKAAAIAGTGEVVGVAALRSYWQAALARQPDLHFTLVDVFEGHAVLTLTYLNHHNVLAAETLWFDEDGHVWQAAACHPAGA